MGDYITELEVLQDENFVIKAPKGFKSDAWRSKSGRMGKVLYDSFAPDYLSSDCYITVSTVAKDPITSEIRRRVEVNIGKDGFDFQFTTIAGKSAVFYWNEEEADYQTYRAFITLSDCKAVIVEVIFNNAYDNSKKLAFEIADSLQTNFSPDVTEEELAQDAALIDAETKMAEQRQAQMAEEKRLQEELHKEQERDKLLEELKKEQDALAKAQQKENPAFGDQAQSEAAQFKQEEKEDTPEQKNAMMETVQKAQTDAAQEDTAQTQVPEEVSEQAEEIAFEDPNMQAIYKKIQEDGKNTLNELQSIPALRNMGRMEIKSLLDQMIEHNSIVRFEEDDKIYFSTPEYQSQRKEEEEQMQDMSEEDRYKLAYEKYKQDMAEWKKSKDFFGRTDMPKPVPPVKAKKRK